MFNLITAIIAVSVSVILTLFVVLQHDEKYMVITFICVAIVTATALFAVIIHKTITLCDLQPDYFENFNHGDFLSALYNISANFSHVIIIGGMVYFIQRYNADRCRINAEILEDAKNIDRKYQFYLSISKQRTAQDILINYSYLTTDPWFRSEQSFDNSVNFCKDKIRKDILYSITLFETKYQPTVTVKYKIHHEYVKDSITNT